MFSWLDKSVHVCMLIAKISFSYRKKYETLSLYLWILPWRPKLIFEVTGVSNPSISHHYCVILSSFGETDHLKNIFLFQIKCKLRIWHFCEKRWKSLNKYRTKICATMTPFVTLHCLKFYVLKSLKTNPLFALLHSWMLPYASFG